MFQLVLRKEDTDFFTTHGETEAQQRDDLPIVLDLAPLTFSNEEWKPEVPGVLLLINIYVLLPP